MTLVRLNFWYGKLVSADWFKASWSLWWLGPRYSAVSLDPWAGYQGSKSLSRCLHNINHSLHLPQRPFPTLPLAAIGRGPGFSVSKELRDPLQGNSFGFPDAKPHEDAVQPVEGSKDQPEVDPGVRTWSAPIMVGGLANGNGWPYERLDTVGCIKITSVINHRPAGTSSKITSGSNDQALVFGHPQAYLWVHQKKHHPNCVNCISRGICFPPRSSRASKNSDKGGPSNKKSIITGKLPWKGLVHRPLFNGLEHQFVSVALAMCSCDIIPRLGHLTSTCHSGKDRLKVRSLIRGHITQSLAEKRLLY